ncbi:hypothetical protein Tco_0009142 [Tanacetum coccineum]
MMMALLRGKGATLDPITGSGGSQNDATKTVDVSTSVSISLTINVVNSETTSPNKNGGDQVQDLVYDEAGPLYDSDTLSEVQYHDNCLDNMNESHEEHEIHNDVQPNGVVDSETEYTSNSNIISYEQYVQDNEDQVVHSDVSSVPNDVVMIITNDIYWQDAQCVTLNNTVNASLTAELARYNELAKVYEKRAQFELTERELMIDTQMRMINKDHNVKEESLQQELHSVKMQLNSTLNHNKLIREEVSMLKQDFKQKENMLLEEFMDVKHFKEKVEDKVAIGYKNPFYLSKAKQVQPALYNGHEIVKTNHARALVHDSEDTLEIAETTKKQMIEKMKDPECVKKKVKIAPHDYSKENYLATFTPQKQLTPEQIFWSDDLLKMKAKTLKEKAKSAKPITAMTVSHQRIKEMKEVFDQMEVEVDQHVVDKKCDEIKRKNLLIENENLISKCLSKDVFYTATDSVLTISRFFDMHDAYTVAHKRIAELEAKNSNLTQKIQKDDHDEMIIFFPNLRLENEKVKKHYKELYDLIKLTHAKIIEKTMSLLTEIETLKAQIKGKTKCVTMPDPVKPKVLAPRTLRKIVKEARVEKPLDSSLASLNAFYTKPLKIAWTYVIGTSCPKDFYKRDRRLLMPL